MKIYIVLFEAPIIIEEQNIVELCVNDLYFRKYKYGQAINHSAVRPSYSNNCLINYSAESSVTKLFAAFGKLSKNNKEINKKSWSLKGKRIESVNLWFGLFGIVDYKIWK